MRSIEVSYENWRRINDARKAHGLKHNNQVIDMVFKYIDEQKQLQEAPIPQEPLPNTQEQAPIPQNPVIPRKLFERRYEE